MISWGRGWGGGETIRNIIFNLPLAMRKSIHPSVFSIHNICIYLYNKSDFPVPCNRTETNLTLYFAVAAENNKTLTDREPFVRPFVHITKCRSHFYIQSIETDANFSWISLKRTKNIQPKRESELLHSNWAHHVPAHDREATTNNNGKQLWWLCCAAFPIGRYGKKHCQLYVAPSALLPLFFFSSRRVDWKRERILDSRNTHSLAMASNFTDLLAVSIELNGRKWIKLIDQFYSAIQCVDSGC